MKWTPWLFGSLTAVSLAACGGSGRENNDTGSTVGGTDTAAMQSGATGTATDTSMNAGTDTTGMSGTRSDTAGSRMHSDSSAAGKKSSSTGKPSSNQTKSGVTDTRTGESTLGEGVTKTSPDQNQPVTAKGDTLSGGDSTSSGSTQ